MSALHEQLKEALMPLADTYALKADHGKTDTELQTRIPAIWQPIWDEFQAASSTSAAAEKRIDTVRSVLELVGREIVVTPVVDGQLVEPDEDDTSGRAEFVGTISHRLDIVLVLYEAVYTTIPDAAQLEPGALFIPLLEDLVELLSVEIWRDLWIYVESRSKRFTKNMPASRGKALPLLRIINAFLRFLPRTPEDLVFRGRVHQFASSVISVADKSAINMRGDYNDVKTTWEEEVNEKEEQGNEGDVDMDKPDKKEEQEEPDFYSTLWSLQQYFSNPPSLDGPSTGTPPISPFAQFKAKTDFVLPKLFDQTLKEKATAGIESSSPTRKRKRSSSNDDIGFFHPRYLTGKRLLSHELADPSFRRQILVQYFILFQFLLNLTPASAAKQAFTGGMPKTFVIGPEDQEWVKKKVQSIREEMRKMGRDGKSFENTVLSVITRERHYAQWKNDGCPEIVFEVPPIQDDSAKKASEGWKKHCAPPPRFPFKLGSRPLSLLWRNGFENIDQLKGWKRSSTVAGLDDEIRQMDEGEEDDKAMGKEPSSDELAAAKELKIKNTWRGLRLASHTHIRQFMACKDKRDLHKLVSAIKAEEAGPAKNTPRSGRGVTEEGDKGVDEAEVKEEEVAETQTQTQTEGEAETSKALPDVEMTTASL